MVFIASTEMNTPQNMSFLYLHSSKQSLFDELSGLLATDGNHQTSRDLLTRVRLIMHTVGGEGCYDNVFPAGGHGKVCRAFTEEEQSWSTYGTCMKLQYSSR